MRHVLARAVLVGRFPSLGSVSELVISPTGLRKGLDRLVGRNFGVVSTVVGAGKLG
jgi:hypothetical protein